jgi:hypothetical protein
VVVDIPGVVKLGPVPNDEPPLDELYQLIVPVLAEPPSSTVPEPQTEPGVVPEMVGMGLIDAITGVRLEVVHPLAVAST